MHSTTEAPWRLAVSQRWAGAPTSAVCPVWHADAPQVQFTAHGASGGAVVLHGLQACQALRSPWCMWNSPDEDILQKVAGFADRCPAR